MKGPCDTEKKNFFFRWPGLDLKLKLSVRERITRLKDIITVYCTTKVHIIHKYANQKEEDTVVYTWKGYKIKLEYPPKTDVLEEQLSK